MIGGSPIPNGVDNPKLVILVLQALSKAAITNVEPLAGRPATSCSITTCLRAGIAAFVIAYGMALGSGKVTPARADIVEDGKLIVQAMSSSVILILRQRTTRPVQEASFETIFRRYFDIPRIARFVVGRAAWSKASADERARFLNLFRRYVSKVYAAQLRQYSGEVFEIVSAQRERDGVVVVSRIINPRGTRPLHIKWRLRPSIDQLKVRDVVIENISMSLNQRRQFASVYRRRGGNMAGLLQAIQEKMVQLDRR